MQKRLYNMKIIISILLFFTSIFAVPAWSIEPLTEKQLTVAYNIPFSGSKNHTHHFSLRVDTIEKNNTALYRNHPTKSFALLDLPVNKNMFALQTYKDQYLTQSLAKTDPIEEQAQEASQENYETTEETLTNSTEVIGELPETANEVTEEELADSTEVVEESQLSEADQVSNDTTGVNDTETPEQSETALNISTQTAVGILLGVVIGAITIFAGAGG